MAGSSQTSASNAASAKADQEARKKGYKSDVDMKRAQIKEREAAAKTEKAQVREQLTGDRDRALGMYGEFSQDRRANPAAPDRLYAEQEGNAPKIEAGAVADLERASTFGTGPTENVKYGLDSSVERIAADDVAAPRMGPTAQASAAGAVASQVNDAQGQQVRAKQLDHVGMLENAAYGRGPSVAEAQLNKALGRVTDEQYGMVAQTRGTERAGARREAMLAIGRQGGDAAADAATLRAQEMTAARGQLGDALSGIRGVDTSVASQNAGMRTDVSKYNAGTETQAGIANMGQMNEMERFRVGTDIGVQSGNADRRMQAAGVNAGAQNQRATQVAAGMYQAGADNANRAQQGQQFNAQQAQGASQYNAQQANAYNQSNADRVTQVNTANVGNTIGVNSRNTGLRQDTNAQNQNMASQTRAQDMQRDAGYRGDMLGASGQASTATMSREQIRQYEAEAKARRDAQRFNQQMAVVGAVASGGQTLLSGGAK